MDPISLILSLMKAKKANSTPQGVPDVQPADMSQTAQGQPGQNYLSQGNSPFSNMASMIRGGPNAGGNSLAGGIFRLFN